MKPYAVYAGLKAVPTVLTVKRQVSSNVAKMTSIRIANGMLAKPPVFGMIQRGGDVVIRLLENVKQKTIEPIIKALIAPGTLVNTDEYVIYDPLETWGYAHKTVCHSTGEYPRDEDGDGFCEVHVNTIEGFWSLLRSWLRPHRGISQENLPFYLGFFEFVHNVWRCGKALLGKLLETVLA